jgi:hypothetical protein
VGFIGFVGVASVKFASGSLTAHGLAIALGLNIVLGLWPVALQRYNRLRLYRAINKRLLLAGGQQHSLRGNEFRQFSF